MGRRLEFIAYGRPAPQGSKHGGATGQMREASRYLNAWRSAVKLAAQRARIEAGWIPSEVACVLDLTFTVARAERPIPRAVDYPAVPPDLDKLARGVADSLKHAAVWLDDSQWVGCGELWMLYPNTHIVYNRHRVTALTRPGVRCRIIELDRMEENE